MAIETFSNAPGSISLSARLGKAWSWLWPKVLAAGIVIAVWEAVVVSGWRPEYVLPSPFTTLEAVRDMLFTDRFWSAAATTMRRALTGFTLALVVGSLIGLLVTRIRPLRLAVGALITGLQTMPSIAWFPFAILIFGLDESAIMFVVLLGAAPSIANGVIAGIDQIPPAYLRLSRVLGARGLGHYLHIVLPAILPTYLGGLNQGWAFAWRSLMAGELLVIIAERPSLGGQLEFARQLAKAPELLGTMLVILAIGMMIDGIFSTATNRLRQRRGLALTK